jgi:hypothetical protein
MARVVEMLRCGDDIVGGRRRRDTILREPVLPVEHQLGRGLARHAIGHAVPVHGAPARRVEVAGVQPVGIHHIGQRADDAFRHEFPEPGKIHGDQVIGAVLAFRVAQPLLAQAVDREGALVNVGADDLLELALEILHDHEGRIAMHQDPQPAGKLQRRQECGRRLRSAACPVT